MTRARDVADTQDNTGGAVAPFLAGKNAIINGAFDFNQRAFTSNTTNNSYNFDRWLQANSGGTVTVTPQTFTAGTAPVAGYEAINFVRIVTASQSAAGDYALYGQKIEDARTFANQTVTVSFWAKAGSGTPNIGVTLDQFFGTAGSTTVSTSVAVKTITTSWARYSFTVNVPSVSGKTIGAGSALSLYIGLSTGSTLQTAGYAATGIQNGTFDIWGVQVEAGDVATAFQTATGTLAGELAACSRYYYRVDAANAGDTRMNTVTMIANSTTVAYGAYIFPVRMRTSPTFGSSTASGWSLGRIGAACTAMAQERASLYSSMVKATVASGLTAGNGDWLEANNNNTAYIEFSAEL